MRHLLSMCVSNEENFEIRNKVLSKVLFFLYIQSVPELEQTGKVINKIFLSGRKIEINLSSNDWLLTF